MPKHASPAPDPQHHQAESSAGPPGLSPDPAPPCGLRDRVLAVAGGVDLFVLEDTLRCVESGCVVCAYKLLVRAPAEPGRVLAPNQRPELCPRQQQHQQQQPEPQAQAAVAGGEFVGLYRRGHRVLLCGDGDLSFSRALADTVLPGDGAGLLVATSFEDEASFGEIYGDAGARNTQHLRQSGAQVLFRVDATALASDARFLAHHGALHRVVFNFPCVLTQPGEDAQSKDSASNRAMLRRFLGESARLVVPGGEVHVTHKTVAPFGDWDVGGLCDDEGDEADEGDGCVGLRYEGAVVFDKACYPGYTNRKALKCQSFPSFDAVTHIFRRPNLLAAPVDPRQPHATHGLQCASTLSAYHAGPPPSQQHQQQQQKSAVRAEPVARRAGKRPRGGRFALLSGNHDLACLAGERRGEQGRLLRVTPPLLQRLLVLLTVQEGPSVPRPKKRRRTN